MKIETYLTVRQVARRLGYSSVRMTEVYVSLLDSDVKRAVERLYGHR